nr:MAG TPA: hypothetical protein [Bacteriophage sp.]
MSLPFLNSPTLFTVIQCRAFLCKNIKIVSIHTYTSTYVIL